MFMKRDSDPALVLVILVLGASLGVYAGLLIAAVVHIW